MNGSRKQSIVYAVRDYQPLKESSVACSATTTDGARSLTMRSGLITDYWYLREAARMGVKQALRSIDAFPRAE
ncbi:unnamed protein product [Brassica oleracea var. botrytis]